MKDTHKYLNSGGLHLKLKGKKTLADNLRMAGLVSTPPSNNATWPKRGQNTLSAYNKGRTNKKGSQPVKPPNQQGQDKQGKKPTSGPNPKPKNENSKARQDDNQKGTTIDKLVKTTESLSLRLIEMANAIDVL